MVLDSLPLTGEVAAAMFALLSADCVRFAKRAKNSPTNPLSRTAIAFGAFGSKADTTIRDIYDDDWRPARLETAAAIEAAWRHHECWAPKRAWGPLIEDGVHGFVLRRFVSPDDSPEFAEMVRDWRERSSDAAFMDAWCGCREVSIVDVRADDPADYFVRSYAADLKTRLNVDKTGVRFSENHNPTYGRAVQRDFRNVKESGEAACRDVLWQFRAPNANLIFRNVTLPCLSEGVIVSRAHWAVYRDGVITRRGRGE